MIDGVPYTVVTWTTALSAVKAGDYPLNLDLPVMVRVKERGRSGPLADRWMTIPSSTTSSVA